MENIKDIAKNYSTTKLSEIVDKQPDAYSESFINHAKDELIKRGEKIKYDKNLAAKIVEMDNNSLRQIVEKDWRNYHLEYMELARQEYIKRNFKNTYLETEYKMPVEKLYSNLRTLASVFFVVAWVVGLITIAATINFFVVDLAFLAIQALVIGLLVVLGFLVTAELIKLLIGIEENTRKALPNDGSKMEIVYTNSEKQDNLKHSKIDKSDVKQITIKNKKSGIKTTMTIDRWEGLKETYGENLYEVIKYHE